MTVPVVLVDPLCLCGRPHPCDLHGVGAFAAELDPALLLELMDEDYRAGRGCGSWQHRSIA